MKHEHSTLDVHAPASFGHQESFGTLFSATEREPSTSDPISAPITPLPIGLPIDAWDEALSRVSQYDAGIVRQTHPWHQIQPCHGGFRVGDRTILLDEEGHQRLFRLFHAPGEYLLRLSRELRTGVIDHHFRELQLDRSCTNGSAVVLSRDNFFRGLDRADLGYLASEEVLEAVRSGIGAEHKDLGVQNLGIHKEAFQIDVVSPHLAEAVRVGDVVRYGLRVRHSLVHDFATTIESFAFRLLCRNGMVQRQCLGTRGTPRSRPRTRRLPGSKGAEQQRAQIKRLAADAWQRLRELKHSLGGLQEQPFDFLNLQRFLRQARMHSAQMLRLVDAAWHLEGAESTAFGFLNALTRVATHEATLSEQQRRRLDLLAGVFAGQHAHLCPKCFSLLAN